MIASRSASVMRSQFEISAIDRPQPSHMRVAGSIRQILRQGLLMRGRGGGLIDMRSGGLRFGAEIYALESGPTRSGRTIGRGQTMGKRAGMSADDGYELLGQGFYWQDLPVGRKLRTIGRTIFESDLMNFIGATGMAEVLFNNLEYIEHESPTGKRILPGALVLSVAEGLVMQATLQRTGFAFLGMTMDIKGPTLVGDTVHVDVEVTESRAASKGARGLVRTTNRVITQRGDCVLEYTPLRLMKGREG